MIQVRNLSKSYGDFLALDKINFDVKKSTIFGLLGPNGAGKSTTLNILNTLLNSSSGEVIINGINLNKNKSESKKIIGVVPQEIALYDRISALDNLLFWGSLYNIPKDKLFKKANEVLELVGLSERKNDPINQYSGGMKRRINIASAILHDPKILLMDEPTVGVDPQSRNHIFEIIESLNDAGMTIIYTTHYMEEAERLCQQIAIIDHGKIIANGTLNELRNISQTKDLLVIKTKGWIDNNAFSINKTDDWMLDHNKGIIRIESDNISLDLSFLVNKIQKFGIEITSVETHNANLESIFLKLTGHQLRD